MPKPEGAIPDESAEPIEVDQSALRRQAYLREAEEQCPIPKPKLSAEADIFMEWDHEYAIHSTHYANWCERYISMCFAKRRLSRADQEILHLVVSGYIDSDEANRYKRMLVEGLETSIQSSMEALERYEDKYREWVNRPTDQSDIDLGLELSADEANHNDMSAFMMDVPKNKKRKRGSR